MPTYNSMKYIRQAIDSIPLKKDVSLIVSDDCSADGTREFLQSLNHNSFRDLKILFQQENVGATENISKVMLEGAKFGKFVMLLAPDDVLVLNDLHSLKSIFRDERVLVAGCIQVFIDKSGLPTGKIYIPPNLHRLKIFALPIMLAQNLLAAPGAVYRSECIQREFFGFGTDHIQDWCIGAHLTIRGRTATHGYGYVRYRRHEDSISSKTSYYTAHEEWYRFLSEHLISTLRQHVSHWSKLRKRIFFYTIRFFSQDKPNCVHKIEFFRQLGEFLPKLKCEQFQLLKIVPCIEAKYVDSLNEKKYRLNLRKRVILKIIENNSYFCTNFIIWISTVNFLTRRIISCSRHMSRNFISSSIFQNAFHQ